ncbi:response regulator [Litorimonas haliclonae]|uniref:response regulator n=1 Tax=Litorimonas haliclonae TaxID=2081977 RepID=UPI0039EE12F4
MEQRTEPDRQISAGVKLTNSETSSIGEKRVLVVEDEALIALQLEMEIEDIGHKVAGTCMNLPECLRFIEDAEIDGAILDVDLRGVDVFPAAEKLRQKNIPFVFHTGHGDKYQIEERFPRSTVFKKPTSTNIMLKKLFSFSPKAQKI